MNKDIHSTTQITGNSKRRYSSGIPTLDLALTPEGYPLGHVGEDEVTVYLGKSGTGKTLVSYNMVVSALTKVVNGEFPDGTVMLFHDTSDSITEIKRLGMLPGQPNAHLARNLIINPMSGSLEETTKCIYKAVVNADNKSRATGRPITDFLPRVIFIDEFQTLEKNLPRYVERIYGPNPEHLSSVPYKWLQQGVQRWNHCMLGNYSGVRFEDYTGRCWPDGMKEHTVAVVAFSRVQNKVASELLSYPTSQDDLINVNLDYSLYEPNVNVHASSQKYWEAYPRWICRSFPDKHPLSERVRALRGAAYLRPGNIVILH